MKTTPCKKLLVFLLAAITCFGCAACGTKDAPATDETLTATETEDENSTSIPIPGTEEEEAFVDEIPDDELLGRIGGWRGASDSGKLTEKDQYSMITVKSKKDLDPYRDYLSNFTAEDEKTILEDTDGICVLIELTGATETTLYGTSSITQAGSAITVSISVDEAEDPLPLHTYFLLYFPHNLYHGETIEVSF